MLEEFDDLNGWTKYAIPDYYPPVHTFDTSDKHSGSACSFWTCLPNPSQDAYLYKSIDLGSGASRRIHIWHKCSTDTEGWSYCTWIALQIGGWNLGHHSGYPSGFSEAWAMHSDPAPSSGIQQVLANIVHGQNKTAYGRVDKFVIFQSLDMTVTGLTPGQKVEIYRSSDDALLGTGTCAGGQSSVVITISDSVDVPLQMYMKIYATDASTLIEVTVSYDMCGGDTWAWTPGAGTLKITVDVDIIYRTAASGTPKTCNLVANLKTLAGANYPGATIYFTTTLGALHDASDVTDASGNAHTELTSSDYGIAVVKANWLGDPTVPACSAYYTVHVFYETETADAAKDFQFFVQGVEYSFVDGHYTLNEIGTANDFEVEIPEWLDTITPHGLVDIYRIGVKEFHGVLKGYKRSLSSDRVTLRGPDVARLLDDSVVDLKVYESKTAQYIINDLLTSFPCGIYPGSLGACPDELTITIDTENLHKAIDRVCGLVGWNYRATLNRTLDFAESFTGGNSSAIFTEGDNIIDGDRDVNFLDIANYVRMKGSGIVSVKQDGTEIQEHGMHQAPAFNKGISDQSTLDTACQALLDMKKAEGETTPLKARDVYPSGTFGPEDYVTVTAPTIGLNGLHQIRRITRYLTDAEYVELDLDNRSMHWWELDEQYRRMTKDASI